eukprot:Plantae.Rhodophyta-Purpureofilum_apyrenoidigerum.ctg2966.p1 GENE.Plantae.Rhodophyta-Purpureofilum_apyrenoidigerum.ctg2966~~Plantae.Rhodophyta-Purpureofilum_apyrenoidigerum.ctg2966.p1  ORF type:complete len:451 (+),score=59.36 Plantae.Rhodophyta-Purpureofilum_apyrenoidigerum.ctg2966:137-1489(+)
MLRKILPDHGEITVTNLRDGETIPHSFALLEGEATGCDELEAAVDGKTMSRVDVIDGKFKAVVELKPGDNTVVLKESSLLSRHGLRKSIDIKLKYAAPPSNRIIRLLYLVASDSDGSFQAPPGEDNSIYSGLRRTKTMGQIIQLITAELLKRQFPHYSRRTFRISDDVYEYTLNKTTDELRRMKGNELWSYVVHEVNTDCRECINIAVMSFSYWDGKKAHGHTALGGGCLGLFGGASMFSWPEDITQVIPRMLDSTHLDTKISFPDGNRKRRFGLCSTSIGACLHELGHCLSLPHPSGPITTANGGGIMARGFDHVNRLFTIKDGNGKNHGPSQEPFFDRGSAARLLFHQFITQDCRKSRPRIKKSKLTGEIIVESDSGIRHVGLYMNDENRAHQEFCNGQAPRQAVFRGIDEVKKMCCAYSQPDSKFKISVIDDYGNIHTEQLSKIKLV